jgi:hypothetical protein
VSPLGTVTYFCPGCGRKVPIPDAELHLDIKCAACGTVIAPTGAVAHSSAPAKPAGRTPIRQEKVYYDDGRVRVTSTRAVLTDRTFVMANIGSVGVKVLAPDNQAAQQLIFWGILGSLCTAGLSLILTIAGIIMMCLAKYRYAVRVSSGAGEVDCLISQDERYVRRIADAINDAIVERG